MVTYQGWNRWDLQFLQFMGTLKVEPIPLCFLQQRILVKGTPTSHGMPRPSNRNAKAAASHSHVEPDTVPLTLASSGRAQSTLEQRNAPAATTVREGTVSPNLPSHQHTGDPGRRLRELLFMRQILGEWQLPSAATNPPAECFCWACRWAHRCAPAEGNKREVASCDKQHQTPPLRQTNIEAPKHKSFFRGIILGASCSGFHVCLFQGKPTKLSFGACSRKNQLTQSSA